jgi:lysophospholipase L1-like esterase
VARSLRQVDEYGEHWDDHNDQVLARLDSASSGSEWWAVLGDSAAQGVGASSPALGWAGVATAGLGVTVWFNLSVSGAKVADVIAIQVPRLVWLTERFGPAERVLVAAGGNDLVRAAGAGGVRRDLAALVDLLPDATVVGSLPQTPWGVIARSANRGLRRAAVSRGLSIADINRHYRFPYSARTSSDAFHPNDRGYKDWAQAFIDVIE